MRWIVDGMNVIGSRPDGWWRDRGRAMTVLVERLERWAVAEGADVTVVFERPPSPPIESSVITVAHAPEPAANSADDEIVRLVCADAHPGQIRVATSDRTLSERVQAAGASVYPRSACAISLTHARRTVDTTTPPVPARLKRVRWRGNHGSCAAT